MGIAAAANGGCGLDADFSRSFAARILRRSMKGRPAAFPSHYIKRPVWLVRFLAPRKNPR
jgi:hypothetical protein